MWSKTCVFSVRFGEIPDIENTLFNEDITLKTKVSPSSPIWRVTVDVRINEKKNMKNKHHKINVFRCQGVTVL